MSEMEWLQQIASDVRAIRIMAMVVFFYMVTKALGNSPLLMAFFDGLTRKKGGE